MDAIARAAEGGMSMGVYIKGMEMPSCCMFCPISNSSGCGLMNPPVLMTSKEMLADRPDWCPLIEIQEPHGRLIDADAVLRRYDYELSRTYTDDFAKGFQLGVKAAVGNGTAVVVEAEEGDT